MTDRLNFLSVPKRAGLSSILIPERSRVRAEIAQKDSPAEPLRESPCLDVMGAGIGSFTAEVVQLAPRSAVLTGTPASQSRR